MDFRTLTEIAANIATFLGVPIAILVFLREKQRERLEREAATYDSLTHSYEAFLGRVIDDPQLGINFGMGSAQDISLTDLDEANRVRQVAFFEVLVSMLEQAHHLYTRLPASDVSNRQRAAWVAYTDEWCERPIFREFWKEIRSGEQFDAGFAAQVNATIAAKPITQV